MFGMVSLEHVERGEGGERVERQIAKEYCGNDGDRTVAENGEWNDGEFVRQRDERGIQIQGDDGRPGVSFVQPFQEALDAFLPTTEGEVARNFANNVRGTVGDRHAERYGGDNDDRLKTSCKKGGEEGDNGNRYDDVEAAHDRRDEDAGISELQNKARDVRVIANHESEPQCECGKRNDAGKLEQ